MGYHQLSCPYICAIFLLLSAYAQAELNESCVLTNGNLGQCVHIKNCRSAIILLRSHHGTPVRCGFEGNHPVVCCEGDTKLEPALVGDISKQKCWEMYSALPANSARSLRRSLDNSGPIDARLVEFPHMAVLGYGDRNKVFWGCAGTLISEKYVLTAAHCVKGSKTLGPIKYVHVGDVDLNSVSDEARPQDLNIARIIVHPDYKYPSVYNDIALIELSGNVKIDDFVRPACLHTETDVPTEEEWSSLGWGIRSYNGSGANHLKMFTISPVTLEKCQSTYDSIGKRRMPNGIDNKTQICAHNTFEDLCQAESGSPIQNKNTEFNRGYKVFGITSFGLRCGVQSAPAVYTRISHYIEWIESIVWP